MIVITALALLMLPPPAGHTIVAFVFGAAIASAQQAPQPIPPPQPDCNCGVPDSPRGPR